MGAKRCGEPTRIFLAMLQATATSALHISLFPYRRYRRSGLDLTVMVTLALRKPCAHRHGCMPSFGQVITIHWWSASDEFALSTSAVDRLRSSTLPTSLESTSVILSGGSARTRRCALGKAARRPPATPAEN